MMPIIIGIKLYGSIGYELNPTDPMTAEIGLYYVMGYDMDPMKVIIMNDVIFWMECEIFIFDILNTILNIFYFIAIFRMIILLSRIKLSRNDAISSHLVCSENEMLIIDVDDTSDRPSWSILGIDGVFDNLSECLDVIFAKYFYNLQNIFTIIVIIIISMDCILFLIETIFCKIMKRIILNNFLIYMTFGIFIFDTLNNTMNIIHFITLLGMIIARNDTILCRFACSGGGILIIDDDDVSDGLSI